MCVITVPLNPCHGVHVHGPLIPEGIRVGVLFRDCDQVCGLWSQVPGFKSWFPTTSLLCDAGLLIKLSVLQLPRL